MKSDITSTKSRLATMDLDLNSLNRRITSLRSDIQATEARYPLGIPSSIYPSYSAQIDELNRLVRQYNSALADYRTLLAQTNANVDSYNALLGSCR